MSVIASGVCMTSFLVYLVKIAEYVESTEIARNTHDIEHAIQSDSEVETPTDQSPGVITSMADSA
jgi:hypothetical protein